MWFAPSLYAIIYHGDKKARDEIRRKHMLKTIEPKFPIVITSYEIAGGGNPTLMSTTTINLHAKAIGGSHHILGMTNTKGSSEEIEDLGHRKEKSAYLTISVDDGIRPNATLTDLAMLKPVFEKDSSITAGNSSQMSDGAGAILFMKRSVTMQKEIPSLGLFRCLD